MSFKIEQIEITAPRGDVERAVIEIQHIAVNVGSKPNLTFVARSERGIIKGICDICQHGDIAEIRIQVHPNYQNRGIGMRLVQGAMKELKEQGIKAVFATTRRGSISEHLFERLGFTHNRDKEDQNKKINGLEKTCHLEKSLTSPLPPNKT